MSAGRKLLLALVSLTVGIASADAAPLVIKFPTTENTNTPAKPKPAPVVRGRCVFPSTSALANLFRSTIIEGYTKNGWKNVSANVRVILPRTEAMQLSFSNIEGVTKFAPKADKPLELVIEGGTEASPVEIGCAMEARVEVTISGENGTNQRAFGKNTSNILVRGVFN